jgi:hypothetical protein
MTDSSANIDRFNALAAHLFSVPYDSFPKAVDIESAVVALQRFSDGLGVTRDAVTAKPQFFITGDGWFTDNLVTNLAQLANDGQLKG